MRLHGAQSGGTKSFLAGAVAVCGLILASCCASTAFSTTRHSTPRMIADKPSATNRARHISFVSPTSVEATVLDYATGDVLQCCDSSASSYSFGSIPHAID